MSTTTDKIGEFNAKTANLAEADAEVYKMIGKLFEYLMRVLPRKKRHDLPRDYTFQHWGESTYTLRKLSSQGSTLAEFTHDRRNDDRLAWEALITDIDGGWLNEVAEFLKGETDKLARVKGKITDHIAAT
jgi:hypothetical protein